MLWGSWLGDEVIIAVDPLVERDGLSAADCWEPLRTWPQLSRQLTASVGGGWFVVLGYDPGTSWLAFADAVLRGRPDGTWVFESLGLTGREDAAAAALARARAALDQAGQGLRPVPSRPRYRSPRPGRRLTGRRRRRPPGRSGTGDRTDPGGRGLPAQPVHPADRRAAGGAAGAVRPDRHGDPAGVRRSSAHRRRDDLDQSQSGAVRDRPGRAGDHLADQGNDQAQRGSRRFAAAPFGQGRGRERHDHRPDAQRPVAGVHAGQRGRDRSAGGPAAPGGVAPGLHRDRRAGPRGGDGRTCWRPPSRPVR